MLCSSMRCMVEKFAIFTPVRLLQLQIFLHLASMQLFVQTPIFDQVLINQPWSSLNWIRNTRMPAI
jgi:hypothetical protein